MTDFPLIQRFYGDQRMHRDREREAEGARVYVLFILLFGLALFLWGCWTKITKAAPIFALGGALALAACATASPEGRVNSEHALEAYKEFSRSCDRVYSWPFNFTISCRSQRAIDEAKAQASAIAAAVKQAVTEALAQAKPAAP